MNYTFAHLRLVLVIFLLAICSNIHAKPKPIFLMAYFKDNGVAGVFLAASTDGIHYQTVNNGKPIMAPPAWPGQNLTRDPSILYHNGKFRMVWTSHWTGKIFGYAESTDLLNWSTPIQVTAVPTTAPADEQPINVWAPEIHWNPFNKEYFILYALTTPKERFNGNNSDNSGKNQTQYDNRIYITRTTNGQTFTDGKLFFDQGFSCIDAVMQWNKAQRNWVMVVKNSRNPDLQDRPGRNLCITYANKNLLEPNFTPVSAPIVGTHSPIFSHPHLQKSMAEGPSLVYHNKLWWLYWDEPAGNHLQLATSPNLQQWTHIKEASFPDKAQHGTVFLVPQKLVQHLLPSTIHGE